MTNTLAYYTMTLLMNINSFIVQYSTHMVGSYALPATFRLEWKWLKVKNTLAYCTMALLMNVGSYALPATFSLEWKWLIVTNTLAYYALVLLLT